MLKLPPKEWSHVACTWDGHMITVYRNGKRADFVTIDIPTEELTIGVGADLHLGALPGKYAWDGMLDVVRLWGRCLEWVEVRKVVNEPYDHRPIITPLPLPYTHHHRIIHLLIHFIYPSPTP